MTSQCKEKVNTKESNDECKTQGTKRSVDTENISSANEWERADLGDDGRKSKFLRLMGATKKEHHGRFIIGDKTAAGHTQHGRTEEETKKLNSELEDQYQQGLELKLSGVARRHVGLGFQPEEEPSNCSATDTPNRAESSCTMSSDKPGDSVEACTPQDSVEKGESDNVKLTTEKTPGCSERDALDSKEKKTVLGGFVRSSSD